MRVSLVSLAAGLALLASGAASAQGYVGGGLGWTHIGVDCSGTTTCDKTSTGGKLYGGFMAGKQLGVEFGYFDWGKASATGTLAALGREAPMATGSIGGSLKTTGWGLGVAYLAPMSSDWGGTLRGGIAQNKAKATVDGFAGSVSKTSTQPYFGLGVAYKMSPNLMVTGEADFSRVKWGADPTFETDSVRLISIGMRYGF